jgi:hypothetical protein
MQKRQTNVRPRRNSRHRYERFQAYAVGGFLLAMLAVDLETLVDLLLGGAQ